MNNRPIKFRAYHKPTKRMFPVYGWGTEYIFEDCMDGIHTTDTVPARIEDCELMEFTGQPDKNNVEICEGDIVKTPASISVVEFDKGLFGLNHDYGTNNKSMLGSWGSECNLRCLYDGYNRKIEVIGNIFQHANLLK